jgi:hypothetical protein
VFLFEWDPSKAKENLEIHRMQKDPNMLKEYDFSTGVQGKYAKRYAEGTNVVVIEPDVAKVFPDHDSVNQALRSLVEIIRRQKKLA